jgi:hypothetical protein
MNTLIVKYHLTRSLIAFIALFTINGCHSSNAKVDMADYGYAIGSSGPVEGIEVVFKSGNIDFLPGSGGYLGKGWANPNDPSSLPESGAIYGRIGQDILPKKIYARWFSYKNQKFYAANIDVTTSLPRLFSEFSQAYGENTSEPTIILGLGVDGEIAATLKASCSYIYICGKNRKLVKIASGVGQEVQGDPKTYLPITKQIIKKGYIAPIPGMDN